MVVFILSFVLCIVFYGVCAFVFFVKVYCCFVFKGINDIKISGEVRILI